MLFFQKINFVNINKKITSISAEINDYGEKTVKL